MLLTGCEKPPPEVSVFSGSASQRVAPICFSTQGNADAASCVTQAAQRAASGETPTLSVLADNVVGISVDPAIAEEGWYPIVGDQRITDQELTTTYFRFTFPRVPFNEQGYPLAVVSDHEDFKGVWALRLEQAD